MLYLNKAKGELAVNNIDLKSYSIKITVIKKLFHADLVNEYANNPSVWTPCNHFEVGDVFITDKLKPWEMPKGFCGWAWADIQKTVYGMARGGQEIFITSCTDGYRPVIFKLERI